jgi:hypothetical protein
MPPLLTLRAMTKWRETTQKSLRVSRLAPKMDWKSMERSGSMSFHARYGETGHHPAVPLGRRLSLRSTGLRLSSPRKSTWAPYMSRHTTKPRRTSSDVRISASSMKEDDNLLLKIHGTTRHSNATKSGSCAVESSRWTIWCSSGCSLEKELISSSSAGRAPSA